MAKCGSIPTPINPGSLNFTEFRLVSRSLSRVVHCWPVALTYCRSSWQMVQPAGGWSPSAYCVPQVVQMKFGIAHHPLGNPHTPGVTSSTEFPAGSRKYSDVPPSGHSPSFLDADAVALQVLPPGVEGIGLNAQGEMAWPGSPVRRQLVALQRGFGQESEQDVGLARLDEDVTARLLADDREAQNCPVEGFRRL